MLSVHLRYTGYVVMYFNGRFARFNQEESFNVSTETMTLHDGGEGMQVGRDLQHQASGLRHQLPRDLLRH